MTLADYDALDDDNKEFALCHLSRDQLHVLWHQRLGHIRSRHVSQMHRHAIGVPKVQIASELDTCPICSQAKLQKAARGQDSTKHATQAGQGIGVDFGFLVQSSSADSKRVQCLQGLNGEVCYCLITDHYSGCLYGECFASKAPPIDFLNCWLLHDGLLKDIPNKYVCMDPGGDLGGCRAIVDLFENAGYVVEPTAPNSSHQNGPCECPHQTIGNALRVMLGGADLAPRFWPYAFHHFIRLYNVTPHGMKSRLVRNPTSVTFAYLDVVYMPYPLVPSTPTVSFPMVVLVFSSASPSS